MEGLQHDIHKHPLFFSKYNNSPANALCRGCGDPIMINTYVYRCSTTFRSNTSQQHSSCPDYFLHKTCSTLRPYILHDIHKEHLLNLYSDSYKNTQCCNSCDKLFFKQFFYFCNSCNLVFCLKCSTERDLSHTLTLLPQQISHFCEACGTQGGKDFSYLCKTCLFWIHKSCASAPPKLIFKAHHNEHPLVLDYSLPEEYQTFGVSCTLCREEVNWFRWLYYCADCRYFAHIKCLLSATESGKNRNINEDVEDVDDPDLVHFPVSENNPFLLYQLIQKFAENFSTTSTEESSGKADKISHCSNGHSLVLFDNFNDINVGETESSDHMICDGCVQPILSPPDSFYGCLDCNFFLHGICAAELPREFQHASHPQHKLIRCDQIGKPNAFFFCESCDKICNGMFYHCESCKINFDLVCAAMPSEIKHDSHKHKLKSKNERPMMGCEGCGYLSYSHFSCKICNYVIDAKCLRKPGIIKHRWDEHQLCLVYPPVKGHPHDFNCEKCSEDINPNKWFYHCRECDTSFHASCLSKCELSNFKFGAIVKDDKLHQHNLKISPPSAPFWCGRCGFYYDGYLWPILTCVSCKYSVCDLCTYFLH